MRTKNNKNSGNILCVAMIFIAIAVVIFTFIIAVFRCHVNNVLYNVKLDMYSMNRSAIIAVNKYNTSIDKFSYNAEAYKKEFIKLLKENYELDNNFKNDKKLISSIIVKEYDIYENREKDSFTGNRSDGRTIHTVMEVKIKPIILKNTLENIFVFTIHEDVALNTMKTKR